MAPRKPISPMTADMIERMATRAVAPALAPKKVSAYDPNDPFADLGIGTSKASTAATNVPGNKPFTGPTLDPDVIAARANLAQTAAQAREGGVDQRRIEAIAAGEGDPDRGFIGLGKDIFGAVKAVGSAITPDKILGVDVSQTLEPVGGAVARAGGAALRAAAPTLDKFDIGRRFVISAIKEVDDAIEGKGFSGKEFLEQGFAGTFGIGEKGQALGFGDFAEVSNIKNPYANQLIGFIGDVVFDPLTWVTGAGGIAKTAAQRAMVKGGTKAVARYAAAEADNVAAALSKKIAQEALDAAVRIGDDASAEAARRAIRAAEIKAAKAAKDIAGDTATRQIGRTANQALAESVLQVRDDAQRFLDQAQDIIGAPPAGARVTDVAKEIADEVDLIGRGAPGFTPGSLASKVEQAGLNVDEFAGRYADALQTVEALTPKVIGNIQTSGLAGIAGSYIDILKGTRTAAQEVLGVRGGLRIYNPLEVFGVGPRRAMVPGTERILNVAGKLVADSRLGIGSTRLGAAVLNNITPTGEGGILGSEDLLRLRTGLRSGRITGKEAEEATRLLGLDTRYRALVQNERKTAAGALAKGALKDIDKDTLNSVLPYLQSDPATWAGRLPPLNAAQQTAYDAVKKQLEDFYTYAARASGATGFVPPKRANYFPQMQSQKALRWAERNPAKAKELADKLNVDRTWFLGNFRARDLKAGDNWFGTVLTDDDVAQGVVRLNEIAKKSGAIDFDFFETDVLEAMSRYANKHAQFSALQKALGSLPEQGGGLAVRMPGGVRPQAVRGAAKPNFLGVGVDAWDDLLNPASMLTATPDQLREALTVTRNLVEALDKPTVIKDEAVRLIEDLNLRLSNIEAGAALAPPGAVAVATDEVKDLARVLYDEVQGARVNFEALPPKRFADYVDVINKGFVELNQFTTPDIAARADIAELFQNAQRLGDEQFAKRAKQLAQDYIRFSKAYLVMRPGFHIRNAISNMYQFVAAGGNPLVGRQGALLQAAVNDGLKSGKTVRQVATEIVDSGKFGLDVRNVRQRLELIEGLEASINYSGATGFGQFGEIAEELGIGRRGFLQTAAPTQKPILNQVSSAVGAVVQGNRKVGTFIENQFRFGLMWDGIIKGLSPQEAAARVNKYLIDYSDYSKADRVARQVIPFWTFMSRNAPLQMEMMFTNPRAYAWYNSFRRNFEDTRTEEEGGMIIPSYERDRGVFALKQPFEVFGRPISVVRPGLPFEGGGEDTLTTLIQNPKRLLSNVSAPFRAPVEVFLRGQDGRGAKFFSEGAIVPKGEATKPLKSRVVYLVRELASPASPISSIVALLPADSPLRSDFLNLLLGLTPDDDQASIQQLQALLNWGGVPLGNIRTQSQVKELESRAIQIGKLLDDKREADKKELEKALKQPTPEGPTSTVPYDPNNPFGDLGIAP